jgi:hypothetical protein
MSESCIDQPQVLQTGSSPSQALMTPSSLVCDTWYQTRDTAPAVPAGVGIVIAQPSSVYGDTGEEET